MDAAYLKEHVGSALAQALSQVVVDQPEDAIDYIGNFLLQHADVLQAKANEATRQANIDEANAIQQARDAEVAAQAASAADASSTRAFSVIT